MPSTFFFNTLSLRAGEWNLQNRQGCPTILWIQKLTAPEIQSPRLSFSCHPGKKY